MLPGTVGPLHGRAEMLAKLPLRVQKVVIEQESKRDPSIGFIVECGARKVGRRWSGDLSVFEAGGELAATVADQGPSTIEAFAVSDEEATGRLGWSTRCSRWRVAG